MKNKIIKSIINSWIDVHFKKIINFDGRAARKEWWWSLVLDMPVYLTLLGLFLLAGNNDEFSDIMYQEGLSWLVILAIVMFFYELGNVSLRGRMLHQHGHSALWAFCSFIPHFGLFMTIYVLYMALRRGDIGENEYGTDPEDDDFYY